MLWLLVVAAVPGIATTLVIASKQIDVIALLMFWTAIGGLLSSRQGKRLVALMTAGGTVGTAMGSFTSGAFGRLLGIPALLAVAGTADGGTAAVGRRREEARRARCARRDMAREGGEGNENRP